MKRTITDEQINEIATLASKGLRQCDIARETGLAQQIVKYWFYKVQGIPILTHKNSCKGFKPCGTCKYMGSGTCDYLIITGHRRNCPAVNCKCYVKGDYVGRTKALTVVTERKLTKSDFKQLIYSQAIREDDEE